jgi:hypothetical protein
MSADKQVAAPTPSQDVASHPSSTDTTPQEIAPEILAVIQTAAAVFVAKKRQSENAESAPDDAWSIKGREIVQASHNLVQRGH